jgi:hypothetical protein
LDAPHAPTLEDHVRPTSLLLIPIALLSIRSPAPGADFAVSPVGSSAYNINGTLNPALTLARGATYTFLVTSFGHPFWIKTVQVLGAGSAFNTGVTNNGTENGTITFAVPQSAPNTLFYICEFHSPMTGQINVVTLAVEPRTWSTVKSLYR